MSEFLTVEAVRANLAELVAAFHRRFGSEIGTDNAREIVSAEYAASREARTRLSGVTQKPAAELAEHLFARALQKRDPGRPNVVVMTAGGTGAGKTTAIRLNRELSDPQFTFDSNLNSKRSSLAKIESCVVAGLRVEVIFVHRDPVEALTNGVLPRARDEGRIVSLEAHARIYREATENFSWLARRFAGSQSVRFQAVNNTSGPGRGQALAVELVSRIRYSTRELLPLLRIALDREHAAGRISNSIYRATCGTESTRETERVSGNS